MFKRQKAVLAMLDGASQALAPKKFVKLMFLLREEPPYRDDQTFYEFVPYKYGPFSFALYRELNSLRRDGYVSDNEKSIELIERNHSAAREKALELPRSQQEAIEHVLAANLTSPEEELIRCVYRRFPWYAIMTELRRLAPKDIPKRPRAEAAIYTIGYEGKTVDGFFNCLLKSGIRVIVDVRANPISRKYGFAKRSLAEIARKLDIDYCHIPELGIPSQNRAHLNGYESYQKLLDGYESEILPRQTAALKRAVALMRQQPSAFLCVEKDVSCCHRGRLSEHAAAMSGLPVVHI